MTTTKTRELTYRDAQNEALRQEMRRDPSVIVMGEDVAGGAGRAHLGIVDGWRNSLVITKGLIQEFGPQRVLDTPISEAGFIGTAVGAALTGQRPVVELLYVDFVGTCLDQLLNNAAKVRYMLGGQAKVPLTVFCRIGAGVGAAAQHSQSIYSILAHIPGLKCVVPSDAYTSKGLMTAAIRDDDPVIVFNHKRLITISGPVPVEPYTLPLGKGRILRPGRDVTLVGISYTTGVCLEAAERLAGEGIDAEVLDMLSLSPLDEELILESVSRTKRLVVVDEDTPRCSVGRDIAAVVADRGFDFLEAPIKCVNAPHTPVPFSPALEQEYIPNAARVVAAVHKQLEG
jgi:pyruvate/2-oxoglutarate/acetoin dehydrogenase E1 component